MSEVSESDTDACLEIDALSNAIDYLRKAEKALGDTGDPFRWKWAVLGIMNGLYGLLVCSLEGGNYANVTDFARMPKQDKDEINCLLKKGDTESYRRARNIEERFLHSSSAKLISFDEALKRARKSNHMERSSLPTSKALELSEKQVQNILRLWRTYRNRFEHFTPISLMIGQADFGPPLSDVIVAVEQLAQNANIWMAYGDRVEDLRELAPDLRKALSASCP